MAEEHFLREGSRRYDSMLHRRTLVRSYIESHYGTTRTRVELMEWLRDEHGITTTYPTLQRDFVAMGVQEAEAVIEGRKVKFWSIPGYVAEFSPERLHDRVDQDIIEAEAYRALMRSAIDIFSDGRRVIIMTAFELAKSLSLWLKNLAWPEIWYFLKEDGSTVIIECRTEAHAQFLVKRLWGDVEDVDG